VATAATVLFKTLHVYEWLRSKERGQNGQIEPFPVTPKEKARDKKNSSRAFKVNPVYLS